ncbi:MAG: MerR family transcriptional regulator, partial [Acidimicrobiales bacterium]
MSPFRFLESQGLIDPERTPSGYRKFYQGDIDRLRWILTQQRDNFLPLKVIKRRVAEEGFDPIAEIDERPGSLPLPEPSL